MGSGIAGISSALELAKRGYKVSVYSKIIPNMKKTDNSFFCTSEVASGFWHPSAYFWQNDKERD